MDIVAAFERMAVRLGSLEEQGQPFHPESGPQAQPLAPFSVFGLLFSPFPFRCADLPSLYSGMVRAGAAFLAVAPLGGKSTMSSLHPQAPGTSLFR